MSIQLKRSRSVAFRTLLAAVAVTIFCACSASAQSPLTAQPTVIPTGNWPAAIYSADLNGDGHPDLIYIDHGATQTASTTHILLNDGKGNFTQSAQLATEGATLAVADIDGDGHPDVLWLVPQSVPGSLLIAAAVALGNGDGTFRTPVAYGSVLLASQPIHLAYLVAGHIASRTGTLDIAFENTITGELFLMHEPIGLGYASTAFESLTAPGPIAMADLNGDGLQDLVVQQGNASAAIYLGSQTVNTLLVPASPATFTPPSGLFSLLLQDVTGDNRPDLIAEGANGRIDVFPGNGDGTFSSSSIGGTGTLNGLTGNGGHLIAIADLNHDGLPDALTATPIGISALVGQATSYFGLKGIYNAGPGRSSYAFADFNGDGYQDLALDSPEGIAILFGNADGSFQTSQGFPAGQPAMSAALGAFTSSKKLDAIVATAATQAQLLTGKGDGTFTAAPTPTSSSTGTPNVIATVQTGDFNGDGNLDFALTADGPNASLPANGNGLAVQLGDGTGNFAPPAFPVGANSFIFPYPSACSPPFDHFPGNFFGSSVVADFNGDGLTDIANRDAASYRILRGNNGSAADSYSVIPTVSDAQVDGNNSYTTVDCDQHAHDLVVTGDLNGDGLPDLVFQGSGPNSGSLLVNLVDATGKPSLLGDLAVDGSLTTPGQLTAPALGNVFNGPAIPVASGGLGFPAFPGSAVIADLDRDGNADLIVTYANLAADPTAPTSAAPNYLYIWFGSGAGKFLTSPKHPVNPVRLTPSRNFYQVALADLNGDNIPDLILSDGYILSVQYGNGDGSFQAEQHLLAGQGLNSLAVADLNGDGKLDLVVANGGTLFANPVANRDVLTPNPDVSTGGITVLLNTYVPLDAITSATLTANPNPAPFEGQPSLPTTSPGQPITVTATLTAPPGLSQPNGSVAFSIYASLSGARSSLTSLGPAVTLDNGSASISIPASFTPLLLPGTYGLVASYSGDFVYGPIPQIPGTLTVALGVTNVVLTPTTPLTVPYGGPVNGTFAVSVVDFSYPPTGTYTLLDNAVAVPECTALSIQTECPYGSPQLLNAGPHVFTINYNGGPANGDPINASSTSAPIDYTVVPDTTSATLSSSLNPANFGAAVTFTVTLSGNLATPTGTVQFLDGSNVIGTATLNAGGIATFTTSTLAIGLHSISAVYAATTNFNAATSNAVAEQIVSVANPVASQVLLSSSLNPAGQGQSVTFTAAVQAQGPFAYIASGTITFLDGSATLGTGTLNAQGIATYTTSALAVGTRSITASFPGSPATGTSGAVNPPNPPQPPTPSARALASRAAASSPGLLPGTSAILAQVILQSLQPVAEGFTLTITPDPISIGVGRTAVLLVTVTDNNNFNQPVQLSCSNLPQESTCTFLQPILPAGGGSTTLQISTAAPHDCGTSSPYFLGSNASPGPSSGRSLTFAALLLAGLTGGGLLRKRRRSFPSLLGAILLLASLGGLTALTGCGHCTDLGTYPGTYTLQVTGTAQGTPITQTQTKPLPLTVTL